jgi:hypothetical protein
MMIMHRFVTVVAVTVLLATLAPCVLGKAKQLVPNETVVIPSSCADVWQPLLHLIDEEYAINFIYDPWFRVSFDRYSTAVRYLGGTYPWAAVELRNDPSAPAGANSCLADVYGDGRLDPEVATKIVAAHPGATIVPQKPQGSQKQK